MISYAPGPGVSLDFLITESVKVVTLYGYITAALDLVTLYLRNPESEFLYVPIPGIFFFLEACTSYILGVLDLEKEKFGEFFKIR